MKEEKEEEDKEEEDEEEEAEDASEESWRWKMSGQMKTGAKTERERYKYDMMEMND